MKMFLQSKNLWVAIVGHAPPAAGEPPRGPPENPTAAQLGAAAMQMTEYRERVKAIADFEDKCEKSLNHIAMNVDRSNANLLHQAANGREAWEVLREHHQAATLGNKLRANQKLRDLRFTNEKTMNQHLSDMQAIFNELAEYGEPLSEQSKVAALFSSAGREYDIVATAMTHWDPDRVTVGAAKEKLLEQWRKLQEFEKQAKKEAEALAVQKKALEWAAQEEAMAAARQRPRRTNGILCYGCKEKGHIARFCPNKRNVQDLRWKLNLKNANKNAGIGEEYFNCFFSNQMKDDEWIVDSGATSHMTSNRNVFADLKMHEGYVTVADGRKLMISGIGTVELKLGASKEIESVTLRDVLCVPGLGVNLISVRKLAEKKMSVRFDYNFAYIRFKSDEGKFAELKNGHYRVGGEEICMQADEDEKFLCVHQWHVRLAHRNLADIKTMQRQGLKILPCECTDDCEPCMIGKMSRKSFPKKGSEVKNVLDLVVSDVCGPIQTESIGGRKNYFVTFIDAASRYCEVKFIRKKDEAAEETIKYIERMKTNLNKKVKIFRSDQGGEYLNNKLMSYLENEGIKQEYTVGYSPEQNGMAERKNRTLMEAARTMLEDAKLPKNHWAEAVNTANHVQNRILNKQTGISPYEAMFEEKPRWNELKQFGSKVYVMIPNEKRRKLDEKSKKMKFVGYDEHAKGFRLSDGKKIIVSREVQFLKPKNKKKKKANPKESECDSFPNFSTESNSENSEEILVQDNMPLHQLEAESSDEEFESAESEEEEENQSEVQPTTSILPRRSARTNIGTLPLRLRDDYEVERADAIDECHAIDEKGDPTTYESALKSPDVEEWKQAMEEELQAIEQNETWELVDLPKGKNVVGSKWIFKTKISDGVPIKRKARLVAQGFSQKHGIDYLDVFAPVARGATLRMLLSTAGREKFTVMQYDVKTAFLNGKLDEEIFMQPPKGYHTGGKICKLRKSLYGLKQAARVWNKTMHESLVKRGCVQNETDHCLYLFTSGGDVVHLLVHVDDILTATNNVKTLEILMKAIGEDFEIKYMGEAKEYLSIDLERDENNHFLISQSKFIQSIIDAAGMTNAKASKYPMDTGYYKLEGKDLPGNDEYRKLIGMLLYLATNSRPDIAASVTILSQRVTKPRDVDLTEVKRVIRYLIGTKNSKLKLSSDNETGIITYSDSDFAGDRTDRKSKSGYVVMMNGGPVAWSSRKQNVVAQSSAEAEYVALTEAVKEAVWISEVAKQFGLNQAASRILTDSLSAISMAENEKFSNSTKHIATKYHFVRDLREKGTISLDYHPTETNIADMLTKPLAGVKIQNLRLICGLN